MFTTCYRLETFGLSLLVYLGVVVSIPRSVSNLHPRVYRATWIMSQVIILIVTVQMGKLKKRIYPKDITINIGEDAPIPECPMPGQK